MNSMLFTDPTTALTLARFHHDDVRRAFGRKLRRRAPDTPTRTPRLAGVSSIPVTAAVEVPAPRHESESGQRVAS